MIRRARGNFLAVTASALTLAVTAGCTAGPARSTVGAHRNVLAINHILSVSGKAYIGQLLDINVPTVDAIARPVHLVSLQLPPMTGVRVVRTAAYDIKRSGSEFDFNVGDLPKKCPAAYPVHAPVDAATVRPSAKYGYFGVITVIVTRPGRYHFVHAIMDYSVGGTRGWQYQDLRLTLTIVAMPARPNPVIAHTGCPSP